MLVDPEEFSVPGEVLGDTEDGQRRRDPGGVHEHPLHVVDVSRPLGHDQHEQHLRQEYAEARVRFPRRERETIPLAHQPRPRLAGPERQKRVVV